MQLIELQGSPWRPGATLPTVLPVWRAIWRALVVLLLSAIATLPVARAAKPLVGLAAPEFVGKTLQGGNVRLSEHLGEVVLIGFWTSWCSTCREQLERLEKLHATYRSAGLIVIGVNLDEEQVRAREVATATRLSFPVLFDATKDVSRRYDVNVVPMLVLVDRSGVARYVHGEMKGRDEADLIAEIRALLDE